MTKNQRVPDDFPYQPDVYAEAKRKERELVARTEALRLALGLPGGSRPESVVEAARLFTKFLIEG
jgi:hypothetical protein